MKKVSQKKDDSKSFNPTKSKDATGTREVLVETVMSEDEEEGIEDNKDLEM